MVLGKALHLWENARTVTGFFPIPKTGHKGAHIHAKRKSPEQRQVWMEVSVL